MTNLASAIFLAFSLSSYSFWFGLFSLCTNNNRNFILILLSIELLLLGLSGYFLILSYYHVLILGHIYVLILITLAGAESALGLALMMILFRLTNNLNLSVLQNLKN